MGASYSQQIFVEPKGDAERIDFGRAGEPSSGAMPFQAARARRDTATQLKQRVASTFAMVAEFRFQHAAGDSNAQLAKMLRTILLETRSTFKLAANLRPPIHRIADDRSHCITDMMQLLEMLMAGARPPVHELSHAMDAVIVHLVQLMQPPGREGTGPEAYTGPTGGINEPTDSTHVDFDVGSLPRL